MESQVLWERHPVRDCYHVFSDGTRVSVLFETPRDKVFVMNLMAILAWKYHLRVYCDVVMDTHFHIVVQGLPENVASFEMQMKRLLGMYFRQAGRPELLEAGIWIDHEVIRDDVELMQKIVYVFRNPMDAGYPYLPEDYPWGVGRAFFHREDPVAVRKVGDMTMDERRAWFHTRENLPEEWSMDRDGMLLARCRVDLDAVHRLFGSPRRFIAFLFVRKKDLAEQDADCARVFLEKRGDAELHAEADEESRRLFGVRIPKLSQAKRLQVAKSLWQHRRTLSRKQLARAVRMDPAVVEAVFH